MGGGAAKGCGLMASAEIIAADGTAKGQFQVRVDVNTSGHEVLTPGINDLVPLLRNGLTEQHDGFALNQDIRRERIASVNYCSTLKQCAHLIKPFQLVP